MEETSDTGEPIATLIIQSDGKSYELIMAGGGGVVRKHEVFGPFKSDRKRARKTTRLLWHLCYQWLQDEYLDND